VSVKMRRTCPVIPRRRPREISVERHRDHKLSQGHLGQDVVHQGQGARVHSSAATARTESATLAAPGHNIALVAGGAEELGKPRAKIPQPRKSCSSSVTKLGSVRRRFGRSLLLEGQQVLLDYLEKRCLLGLRRAYVYPVAGLRMRLPP